MPQRWKTGSLLQEFQLEDDLIDLNDDGQVSGDEDLRIDDCEYVASYNWADSVRPTIMVPGKLILSMKSQLQVLMYFLPSRLSGLFLTNW